MNQLDQKTVALLNAAARGHHHLVPKLLASGASVNGGDDGSRTPLHVASLAGHESVVETLIKAEAQIEAISLDDNGMLNLHKHPSDSLFNSFQILSECIDFRIILKLSVIIISTTN